MRVAIYARVSTTDQNCELQLASLKKFVDREGWQLVKQLADIGFSGKKNSRPALDELIKLVEARQVDVVCCTKLDRFGRSVLHIKNNIDMMQRYRVRFMAIDQGLDTDKDNPYARFMLNMLAGMAELEIELNKERRLEGILKAKEKGIHFGRPKAIFRRDKAVELYQSGMSLRKIANELNTSLGSIQRSLKGVSKGRPELEPFPVDFQAA